ncbi:DUF2971 domain-containing protein [Asticcacaulis sp. EMRT-3]|uniref:DUF2971 domain-containing protein n=1 Tax=Asticcacaulis sp. EMRT-3 TaxID=3040349 RepID=UPI0024AF73EB|nr:DUF2971 domain-containing protein [Asticcacaulis sp. EMRT-3]MDI7774670.1 DUF2971 domain-containing protein [Asticcacaulis sp. EMRT-3]
MTDFLYRFRSLNAVLGVDEGYEHGRSELEKQTIYFATPEELNDPVEGFKDIFWNGDQIAWENLLKHYLLCLEDIIDLFSFAGGERAIVRSDILVFLSPSDLPTNRLENVHKRICERFFNSPSVIGYPAALAKRRSPVRYNELAMHLKRTHIDALNCILDVFEENRIIVRAGRPFVSPVSEVTATAFCQMLDELEERHPDVPDGTERFLAGQTAIVEQLNLIERFNSPLPGQRFDNLLFLVNQFPNEYVLQLQTLIYPAWYTASFSASFENASLWGHYSENHTGVCLKFRTHKKEERQTLPLPMITGYGGGKDNPQTYISNVDMEFEKITYKTVRPAVDFFRSIGKLPIPKLNATWYVGSNGERSSCHDDVFSEHDKWRSSYWSSFKTTITAKTEDWAYEQEYRLLMDGFFHDYSDPKTRSKIYDFNDLEGIIFGINTPADKKLAIMRIIERKCVQDRREGFEFSQAYYCQSSGKIKDLPLRLLTPKIEPEKVV